MSKSVLNQTIATHPSDIEELVLCDVSKFSGTDGEDNGSDSTINAIIM